MADPTRMKAKLTDLRHFLLDMDGTIYLGKHPIPGSREFLAYLDRSGRRRLFFTNNCSSDAASYSRKLAGMGIPASASEILTAGEATVRYLISETPYRRVFVLGTPTFEAELERAGITLTDNNPEAVVLAFDKTLTYAKLETACLLLRQGLPYFATNPDKVCPTEYGYIPDCGSMAALLCEATGEPVASTGEPVASTGEPVASTGEPVASTGEPVASTGRIPKFIGKPNPEMVRMGLEKLGATPETTAMVGDRLYTDMQMAYDSGVTAILVLSGETRRDQLERASRQPDFMFASVEELTAALQAADDGRDLPA